VLSPDLWVPLTAHARGLPSEASLRERQNNSFIMGARLKPGVRSRRRMASRTWRGMWGITRLGDRG